MDMSGIRWWALIAWLMVLLVAGASAWVGIEVLLLAMSHPGLTTRQTWIGNASLLVGGAAATVVSVTGLARELRR
jgi:TRAP-type C4-dicarboxylate transport system permease small subunit